jgi:hypothetical protein
MRKQQLAMSLAIVGLLVVTALALMLALMSPDRLWAALTGGLTLPFLWGTAELLTKGDKTGIRFAVAVAALVMAIALGAKVAVAAGLLAPDNELGRTLFGVASGLVLAAYGNRIPKLLQRYDPTIDSARRQAFQREAAWVFVITGLASAAAWLALPGDSARFWATLILAVGVALVLARLLQCRLRRRGA